MCIVVYCGVVQPVPVADPVVLDRGVWWVNRSSTESAKTEVPKGEGFGEGNTRPGTHVIYGSNPFRYSWTV